jgi:fibronectin type 3 domain-containing protein
MFARCFTQLVTAITFWIFCFVAHTSASEITLTWNANPEPDIAGYKVYATDLANTNRSVFNVGLQTEATFEPEPGRSYSFAVTAYNSVGLESDPSSEVRYTAPPDSLSVSWDPSVFSSAAEYRLSYGQLNQTAQQLSTGNKTSTLLSGLVRGASYYFYVEAFNIYQQRIDSWQQVTALVPAEGPLGNLHIPRANLPPQITLTAPASGASFTAPATILLTAAASDPDSALRSVDFYSGATRLASINSAPYSFSWNSVPAGTYQLSAVALDTSGANTRSAIATVTVTPGIPPAPTALAAAPTETTVRLTWSHSGTDESGFRVYRASGGTFSLVATLAANSIEHTDLNLTPGTAYTYRVAAFNTAGTSAAAEISVNTLSLTPSIPQNVIATPLSTSIVIGWSQSAGATQYSVERSLSSAGPFASIGTAAINQFTDSTVAIGTTYFYRILAHAGAQASAPSDVVSAVIAGAPPTAPRTLSASASKANVKVMWKDSSTNEEDFIIERSLDGSSFSQIAIAPANTQTYVDSNIAPRRRYYYRVAAANSAGSRYSPIASCTTR